MSLEPGSRLGHYARAESDLHPLLCFNGFPVFDPVRADPRFTALLERLGMVHKGA